MTLKQAQALLKENFERALSNPTVYSPIAWALYHTWREVDVEEERRRRRRMTHHDPRQDEDEETI